MKKINFEDKVYRRGEKLAEELGTTVQELLSTLAEEALLSLENQVSDMKKRTARVAADRESCMEAMNLVFMGLSPEDNIQTDPEKIKAIAEEQERSRLHNMAVSKKLGRQALVRQRVA